MRRFLAILALVIIMLLLLIAAFAGTPTDADAAGAGLTTLTASTLEDGRAETIFCQVNADREQYTVSMYIYPWDMQPVKGFPLVIYLDYESSNGNCHTFAAEWHPGNLGMYHADTYVSRGGGNLIYYHNSTQYARVWLPMAFYSGVPDYRPEVEQ